MAKNTNGFTIVELVAVIIIIGILSTIGVLSYSKIQASSRDSQRSSKVEVLVEALEKYYDQNGEYPSCSAMSVQANQVVSTTLTGMDPTDLTMPQATPGSNSILSSCGNLTGSGDQIAYIGDGSSTCQTTDCLQYTIKYKQESTGNIVTITSRRRAVPSSVASLSASVISPFQINLSWSAANNALSYTAQVATNSNFTANLTSLPSTSSVSESATGLNSGTTYYFRVMPNASVGSGSWSNTINAKTTSLQQASYSLSGLSQSQSTTVTIANLNSVYSASTNNGSVSYSKDGSQVTLVLSNGTASQGTNSVWDSTKYSKTASSSIGPQGSTSFPASVSYNDGTYSGTLSKSGSYTTNANAFSKTATVSSTTTGVTDYILCIASGDKTRYDYTTPYPTGTNLSLSVTYPTPGGAANPTWTYNDGTYSGTVSPTAWTGSNGSHSTYYNESGDGANYMTVGTDYWSYKVDIAATWSGTVYATGYSQVYSGTVYEGGYDYSYYNYYPYTITVTYW